MEFEDSLKKQQQKSCLRKAEGGQKGRESTREMGKREGDGEGTGCEFTSILNHPHLLFSRCSQRHKTQNQNQTNGVTHSKGKEVLKTEGKSFQITHLTGGHNLRGSQNPNR